MKDINYFFTTLSLNPEYFEDLIRLIEQEFHYTSNNSYEKDFFPLMNPNNFENCYLYIDKHTNEIISHVAISLRLMKVKNAEVSVAFVGGIVTNPKHRGKKFFKNLMCDVLNLYNEKIALYFLWSELENIYEKFSFYRTGGFVETGKQNLIYESRPNNFLKTNFKSLNEKEIDEIKELYRDFILNEFFSVIRTDEDWDNIKEINSVDLYIKKNKENKIESYFCINKGQDLNFIIHEFATKKNDETLFIKQLLPYKLWLPESKLEYSINKEIYYSAYTKIGSIQLFNDFIKQVTNSRLFIIESSAELVVFSFDKKEFHVTAREFLQYLFGPHPIAEFKEFKLSPYVSGLDSV